jgi:hypothetical protein
MKLVSYSDAQYCQMLASVGQQSCASDNGRCPVATVRRNVYLEHRARNIERAQLSLDLVDKESAEQAVREAWDLSGDYMDNDNDWCDLDTMALWTDSNHFCHSHGEVQGTLQSHT